MPVGTSLNLRPNEKLYTHTEGRSYVFSSGKVNIFLARWDTYKNCPKELLTLVKLDEGQRGTVIPAMCFTAAHEEWRICIHALQRHQTQALP